MTDKIEFKKTNWIPTIISIVFGISVALFTTWYTIYSGQKEAAEAETERLNNVKANLVSIIEEHIVNKDSIDLASLSRMIYNRTKEENLYKSPTIYNLLVQAEFNIQNSQHLSFDKKKEYTKITSSLYSQIVTDTTLEFSSNRFPEHTAQIIKYFEQTNKIEGKKSLIALIDKYEQEIVDNVQLTSKSDSPFEYLFKSPATLIIVSVLYLLLTMLFYYYIRTRKRKREMYNKMKEQITYEREKIKEKTEMLIDLLEREDIDKNEKNKIEEELKYLYNKLESMENYYRQQYI